MNISELTPRQGNVEVEGTIVEIGEPKTFNKFGKELRVADASLKDDSGTVKLTLWNDDIERFKAGDKIKISNGYVNEFQGDMQLTSGKFGNIEKVGEGESSSAEEPSSDETVAEASEEPAVESESSESEEPASESEEASTEPIKEEEF